MRVLMTTNPGLGHIHPMIPVAQALQAAGHEVRFACSKSLCARLSALGFAAVPAGIDWLESEADRTFPELREIPLEQRPYDWMLTNVFVDIAAHRMVPDLLALCRDWQPSVIVRNDFEFSSCIVAERLDIPFATIGIESFLPWFVWDTVIGDHLRYLRGAFGLPIYPDGDTLHPYLYLSFMPPRFQFPAFDLPAVTHAVSPHIFDQSEADQLPPWVEQLPPAPTVYATLGTVYNRHNDMFRTIIAGLNELPVNLVLTIGANRDPQQFGAQPAHVRIERYIPQTFLLPFCDLAITHCGYHTSLSVMNSGVPMLCVPVAATDPLRAMRYDALQAGLAFQAPQLGAEFSSSLWGELSALHHTQWLPFTAASLRDGAERLLREPIYRQNARLLQAELHALPPLDYAVELLVTLAQERRPLFNEQLAPVPAR